MCLSPRFFVLLNYEIKTVVILVVYEIGNCVSPTSFLCPMCQLFCSVNAVGLLDRYYYCELACVVEK